MSFNEWKEVKLGDICEFQEGYVNPSQKVPDYFGDEVKWIRANDLNNGYVFDTSRKLSLKGFKSAGKSALLFEPDSIVISKSGTIGRLGIIKDFMCGNRATINIKTKKDVADYKYIFYHLLKNQSEIEDMAVGSVQRNLYTSILGSISLTLPPLIEQKAITATLSCLDDKIELNNRINKTLEEMAQAIFKSWFVDFEPFQDGEFEDSEVGRIPKGWRVGRFTEIVEVCGGGTPKTGISAYWNGNIPFFTPKDCTNGYYSMDTEKHLTSDGLNKCNSKLYPKDTVFVTARGTVGKVNMAICDMAMNQSCYALIGYSGYSQYFVHQLTMTMIEKLRHKASGAVFDAIVTRDFDTELVCIPPNDILDRYDKLIKTLYLSIEHYQKECKTFSDIRDTILPKLMNGEIRVPIKEVQ